MSLLQNIDRVAFATAFEIDKVYQEKFTGSFTVAASSLPGALGNVTTYIHAQTYGEEVLPVMVFSTNNVDWYEAGSRVFTEGATLEPNFTASCYTTSSTLVIVGQNFTGSPQTCYYKAVLISEV